MPIDYDALAEQARKIAGPPVDYDALAAQARGEKPLTPARAKELSTPTDIFHKPIGESVREMAGGAWRGVTDLAKSLPLMVADPLGTETARITGRGETDPLKAGVNFGTGLIAGPVREAVTAGHEIGSGQPEAMGRGLFRGAMAIPMALGTKRMLDPAVEAAAPVVAKAATAATETPRRLIAGQLRKGNVERVQQALNPTTNANKVLAQRVAPEMLKRRVWTGNLGKLESLAETESTKAGQAVGAEVQKVGQQTTPVQPLVQKLEQSKAAYTDVNAAGQPVVISPGPVAAIQTLQDTLAKYGNDISLESMNKVRMNWDDIVNGSKGFTTPDVENAAWAAREGRSVLRKAFSQAHPDIDKVMPEYAFWQTVEDLASARKLRQVGQAPGGTLLSNIAGGVGAVVGEVMAPGSGVVTKAGGAIVGAKLASMLKQLTASPGWKMWTAVQREKLADLIWDGKTKQAAAMMQQPPPGGGLVGPPPTGPTGGPTPPPGAPPSSTPTPFGRGLQPTPQSPLTFGAPGALPPPNITPKPPPPQPPLAPVDPNVVAPPPKPPSSSPIPFRRGTSADPQPPLMFGAPGALPPPTITPKPAPPQPPLVFGSGPSKPPGGPILAGPATPPPVDVLPAKPQTVAPHVPEPVEPLASSPAPQGPSTDVTGGKSRGRATSGAPGARAFASAPKADQPYLRTYYGHAQKLGWDRSPQEFHDLFKEKLTEARDIADEMNALQQEHNDPAQLFRDMAKLGGIEMVGKDHNDYGEMKWLREAMDVEQRKSPNRGALTGSGVKVRYGGLGGVRHVLKEPGAGGRLLDHMAEGLRQMPNRPQYADIDGPNALHDAIDNALRPKKKPSIGTHTVDQALKAIGAGPKDKWWEVPF